MMTGVYGALYHLGPDGLHVVVEKKGGNTFYLPVRDVLEIARQLEAYARRREEGPLSLSKEAPDAE
jgi:hypothetical protein